MRISTKKTEVLFLSRNPRKCMLQVSGNTLQQVEKFKYLGVVFMNDGRRNEQMIRGLVILTQLCMSFQTPQSCQFLNSDPHLWP